MMVQVSVNSFCVSAFIFERFSLDVEFQVDVFCSQHFNDVSPQSSHIVFYEKSFIFVICSFAHFSSHCLLRFFALSLVLSNLIMMCCCFLCFCAQVWLSFLGLWFSSNLENFQPLFKKFFFWPLLSVGNSIRRLLEIDPYTVQVFKNLFLFLSLLLSLSSLMLWLIC